LSTDHGSTLAIVRRAVRGPPAAPAAPAAPTPDEEAAAGEDGGDVSYEPRADGGAIHVAVWVPYEQAQARVDAALAAGGRMVRDDFAPSWWTLADAAGNEADVATVKGRD